MKRDTRCLRDCSQHSVQGGHSGIRTNTKANAHARTPWRAESYHKPISAAPQQPTDRRFVFSAGTSSLERSYRLTCVNSPRMGWTSRDTPLSRADTLLFFSVGIPSHRKSIIIRRERRNLSERTHTKDCQPNREIKGWQKPFAKTKRVQVSAKHSVSSTMHGYTLKCCLTVTLVVLSNNEEDQHYKNCNSENE